VENCREMLQFETKGSVFTKITSRWDFPSQKSMFGNRLTDEKRSTATPIAAKLEKNRSRYIFQADFLENGAFCDRVYYGQPIGGSHVTFLNCLSKGLCV
jgi:hypothetical protein